MSNKNCFSIILAHLLIVSHYLKYYSLLIWLFMFWPIFTPHGNSWVKWQCLKWLFLAVIRVCSQAVRWHRCFRICLQKSWENNIFSQFSLLSIFNYCNGLAFKYRKKGQNLPALAGIPVPLCKPNRTNLLQLFHTYQNPGKKPQPAKYLCSWEDLICFG